MVQILTLPIFLLLRLLSSFTSAANFEVANQCSYTVWAAASNAGGVRLDPGQSWIVNLSPEQNGTAARVWGRTNCNFDANGRGSCETGDCNGLLRCNGYGTPPCTQAQFSQNFYSVVDFIVLSLVDGFNIPMDFTPMSGNCPRGIRCAGNSILNQCPDQLKATGGCRNPCTVYNTSEYCCDEGRSCGPTHLSKFFKQRCPDAYTYPLDDANSSYVCGIGTNYRVTFCP